MTDMADDEVGHGRRARRVAVSAERYTPDDLNNHKKRVVPKSKDALKRIDEKLQNNFLFQHQDEEGRADLALAVIETRFSSGDTVIQQGDKGDNFYILESGTCEIFVDDKKVMTCNPGDSFGELALMYNAPRAATVKAVTDVICWAMDRVTFKLTLMDNTLKKRDKNAAFLEEIPLLGSLLKYERLTIADALTPQLFKNGDVIIKQGDAGDNFYILESGECTVHVDGKQMGEIEAGGYFGELALLHDQPRAATITASSPDVKVLSLDKSTFTGVMGPLHTILKRNGEQYKKFCS